MPEFVLQSNYLEFNSNVKHQISGAAIGTKFTPPFACIYTAWTTWRISFSKMKKTQSWIRFRYREKGYPENMVNKETKKALDTP